MFKDNLWECSRANAVKSVDRKSALLLLHWDITAKRSQTYNIDFQSYPFFPFLKVSQFSVDEHYSEIVPLCLDTCSRTLVKLCPSLHLRDSASLKTFFFIPTPLTDLLTQLLNAPLASLEEPSYFYSILLNLF